VAPVLSHSSWELSTACAPLCSVGVSGSSVFRQPKEPDPRTTPSLDALPAPRVLQSPFLWLPAPEGSGASSAGGVGRPGGFGGACGAGDRAVGDESFLFQETSLSCPGSPQGGGPQPGEAAGESGAAGSTWGAKSMAGGRAGRRAGTWGPIFGS